MHFPVLLDETLDYLAVRPDGLYLDCTSGWGGHTGAIARRLSSGLVIANDQDAESIEHARAATADCADRIRFHHGPFSRLPEALAAAGVERVNGLVADLGVSRPQLTDPERGFSFMSDGPVDMRMNRAQEETAADIVNFYGEKQLADLIFTLGEERRSRGIARAIVRARPIQGTRNLAKIIESAAPRTGPIHPATRTFMALRMAVNRELEELDALLELGPGLVASGGRMCVITFHSLEDRKVKRSFQQLVRGGRAIALTKHVVRPGDQEIRNNPPSRGAKLRVVEMR
jgi:16S rRNA (cytosine1402-N4)-methyltransferase